MKKDRKIFLNFTDKKGNNRVLTEHDKNEILNIFRIQEMLSQKNNKKS